MFLKESNELLNLSMSTSLNVEIQCRHTIKIIQKKLNDGSLKTKEEKIQYLNKMKQSCKRGCTWRQNKNPLGKKNIQRSYDKLFAFIDNELRKLGALNEDTIFLNENYIIPEKNLEINLEKWNKGTPLWITGTSGDGKTTLAIKLAEKHNAIVCSTDYLLCRLNYTKERWEQKKDRIAKIKYEINPVMDFIDNHPNLPYNMKENNSWSGTDKMISYFNLFFNWFILESKNNPKYNKFKLIIEGCDICLFEKIDYIAKQPLIIIGCSRLQSSFRRIKRDMGDNHSLIESIFREIKRQPAYIKELDDSKDEFKKKVKKERRK